MVSTPEQRQSSSGDTERSFDKLWERIKQGLEVEAQRLKGRVEQDPTFTPPSVEKPKLAISQVQNPSPSLVKETPANKPLQIVPPAETVLPNPGPKPQIAAKPFASAPPPENKASPAPRESPEGKLFKGRLKLEIVPRFGQELLEGVPGWLSRLPGLKIISTGGYAGTKSWTAVCTIELLQAVPLIKILSAVPQVVDVAERNGKIVITLR